MPSRFAATRYLLILLSAFALVLVGCDDDDAVVGSSDDSRHGEIFGTLFDATTGERLSGAGLNLYLISGGTAYAPNSLDNDPLSPFAGDYAFFDVPISSSDGIYTHKMVGLNSAYQRFEGYLDFADTSLDAYVSLIRNIYLFPMGSSAGDIEIFVERDNERISNAEVILQQNVTRNQMTTESPAGSNFDYRLFAAPGLLPRLTAVTNGQGIATFSGLNLVLGGAYTPFVLPLSFEDTRLALAAGTQIVVGDGATPLTQLISLVADEVPGDNPEALYVVYASNQDSDDITGPGTGAGVLTVVFNRPVQAYREGDYRAFLNLSIIGGAALSDTPLGNEVNGSVSSDGYTLTLTPLFLVAPQNDALDAALTITYTNGRVTLSDDDQNVSYNIFLDLEYLDGMAVSPVVAIIDPGAGS